MTQKRSPLRMPEELIIDMNERLPGDLTLHDLQVLFKGKIFKFIIFQSSELMDTDIYELELSVRSTNSLKRAGFSTVGDLTDRITGCRDLINLRNCGKTSVSEIMGRLFFYQYSLIPKEKRNSYLRRILQINGIKSC